jgi:hypothetical protein
MALIDRRELFKVTAAAFAAAALPLPLESDMVRYLREARLDLLAKPRDAVTAEALGYVEGWIGMAERGEL